MHESLAVAIAVVVVVGVGAQWLASALRVPSVLVLLPAGLLVGPVLGLVDPDELFGDALFPVIAIAVGLILFEGGVRLRLGEARAVRRPVAGLVTVGVAITWVLGGVAAVVLFDLPRPVGFLLGAILVVSGPTVVLPLLASVRLREPVEPILRWECIVVDPIGAVLAVAVFEAILDAEAGFNPVVTLAASAAVGVAVGAAAGFGLAALLRFHLVPDRLHNPVALAAAIACFVAANRLSVEAGLFATTVMGIVLVNQRLAPVAHIAAFGEDLGVLILGALFVVLGSAVDLSALQAVLAPSALLLVVLLATRPLAVWAATIGARLRGNERWYLSLMAPRGVVAASVAALFSVSLRRQGVDGAEILAPAAFCVIVGTVLFASLGARPAARWLRVADAEPRGVLLAGDQWWLRDAGAALAASGVPVLVVATADEVADEAVANGLLSYAGPLDDDELAEAMHGVGVGEAVVAAGGDGVASFLVDRLSDLLGRRHVYRVATAERRRRASRSWGRQAFPELADPDAAVDPERWRITTVPALHLVGDSADVVPLFLLREDAEPVVLAGRRAGGLDGPAVVAERCVGEDGPAAPG